MGIEQHRNKEVLGGVIHLLTIDASGITDNPAHIRRYVNHHGEDGTGVTYQGSQFRPQVYDIRTVKRSAKSNKVGSKVLVANQEDSQFSRFIDDIGGSLSGARLYEFKVYERFLDGGIEPNPLAYIKRIDHKVNYTEDSDKGGVIIIHTIDPLSRDIKVPSIAFSAGVPNSAASTINVFPALSRDITEGRG